MYDVSSQSIWINLPVSDLMAATRFYRALGFQTNERFPATPQSASLIGGRDKIVVMLFDRALFGDMTAQDMEIDPAKNGASVLFSLGAGSRAEVNEAANQALSAGGSVFSRPVQIGGNLYGCGLCDPDGNRWNVLYIGA